MLSTRQKELKIRMDDVTKKQQSMLKRIEGTNKNFSDKEMSEYRALDKKYSEMEKDFEMSGLQKDPILMDPNDPGPGREIRSSKKMDREERIISPERRADWQFMMTGETRDLQKDSDLSGGFATVSEDTESAIISSLRNDIVIAPYIRDFEISSDSKGIPVLDTDVSDPTFKGEIAETDWDTDMNFEKRVLRPKRLVKGIKWSRVLEEIGVVPFGRYIESRLNYKLATTLESKYLTGTGANEPLGLATVSSGGVTSSRDTTTASSSSFTADELINMLFTLKAGYLRSPNCRFILHRNTFRELRKKKDGEGNYLVSGLTDGNPGTILGIKYLLSEYMKDFDSATTGDRIIIVGDLNFYGQVRIKPGIRVQTLVEKYAPEGRLATLIELWVDGAPLLSEAFSCLKLG